MKRFFLLTLSLFTLAIITKAQEPMVLEFNTNLSEGTTITLPLQGTVNVTVNWGDGNEESFTSAGNIDHIYAEEGTYTVSINGTLAQFGDLDFNNAEKLIQAISFGELGLTSLYGAFCNASNLSHVPEEIPVTVTNTCYLFANAIIFNQDIGNWDVSNVLDMSCMFLNASVFNQDIGSWDVKNVKAMTHMFDGATEFNQNIGNWDVSSVNDLRHIFSYALNFNQDIGNWNVGNVTNMTGMFLGASLFNKDIGNWDVSNVKNMSLMFANTTNFNKNINNWDVSSVTDMSGMFSNAMAFNQDIGSWNVNSVSDMSSMFNHAEDFNQDIGSWNVSNVTDFSFMFGNCISFNQDISNWDVSSVIDMSFMFKNASAFNQNIGYWNVINVENMYGMFQGASKFNQKIDNWNTNNVKNMSLMFNNAINFNQNISYWDMSNVSNIDAMFWNAESFNQDIGNWDVSKLTQMISVFKGAISFNQNIGGWDVSNVTYMGSMFSGIALSTTNYNSLLLGWATRSLQNGVTFNGGESKYSPGTPADARSSIIDNFGWTITDGGESNLPAVITSKVSEITPVTATSGGDISEDGGSDVIVRGIVWNSTYNPTLDNNNGLTEDGSGMGTFLSNLHDLNLGTKYYVRSYATNANGTEYGNTVEFTASQELQVGGEFFVNDKEYDGTTEASIESSNFTLENIISGHENVELVNPLAEFDNKNIGINKEVSLKNASLLGDDSYKYYLSFENTPTTTANITAKELTIGGSFTALDKEYDGTMEAIIDKDSLVLITPIDLDTVMLTGVVLQFSDEEIGEDKTVSIIMAGLEGVDSNNYTLSLIGAPTTTASITQPVGIPSTSLSEVNVYPNPFRDVIHITSTKDVSQVVITNILGKVLVDINYNQLSGQTITTNLPSGIYMVSVIASDGSRVVRKIVKE